MLVNIIKKLSLVLIFLFIVKNVQAEDYTLSSGDIINITVLMEEDLSGDILIGEAESFDFPLIGKIDTSNKTLDMVKTEIVRKLKAGYLVNPIVSAKIVSYRSIFVSGQVRYPSKYQFEPNMTIKSAVTAAGGFTERGSKEGFEISRDGIKEKIITDNLSERVRPGDIITINSKFF